MSIDSLTNYPFYHTSSSTLLQHFLSTPSVLFFLIFASSIYPSVVSRLLSFLIWFATLGVEKVPLRGHSKYPGRKWSHDAKNRTVSACIHL